MSDSYARFRRHFSDSGFNAKLRSIAGHVGRGALENALVLYYVGTDPATPFGAKATVLGALGYLILPLDFVPDFLPIFGLIDDAAALATVISKVAEHISESHRIRAREKVSAWLGPSRKVPIGDAIDI